MGTEIDRLEVQVEAQASKANSELDKLIGKLSRVANSLASVNGSGLTGLANGVQKFAQASAGLTNVKTADFTRLAKNIQSISSLNTSQMYGAAASMTTIARSVSNLGAVSESSVHVAEMAKNIAKLGGVNVQRAITNLPQLATSLYNFIGTMSRAPQTSQNIIQMTNALAALASQGGRAGAAANAVSRTMNLQAKSAERAAKSNRGLASALGSLYQKYFWVSRVAQKAWVTAESSMDFLETVNYFEVAMRKIGGSAAAGWSEAGYGSAEAYAESFSDRLKQLTTKMTGFKVDTSGNAVYTGDNNLGMNPDDVLQWQAVYAQMTDSLGLAEESTLRFSKVLTMLGADWASLRNISFDTAWNKFASALAGQSRAVRSLGIDITQATLQEYAYKYGMTEAVAEMNQATKAQLRLLAIMDQSVVAYGDLANTIASPANQLRMLQQNFANLGRTLGNLFLPMIQKALPMVNGLAIAFQNLFSWVGGLMGIKLDNINSSMGGMSDEMADLVGGAEDYETALDDANGAAKKLKNNLQNWHEINNISMPDSSAGAADGGAVGGGAPVLDDAIFDALTDYEKVWNEAFTNMENKAQEFAKRFEKYLEPVKNIINDFAIGDYFKAGKDTSKLVAGIFNYFAGAIDKVNWYKIGQNIGDYLAGIDWVKVLGSFGHLLWEALKASFELYAGAFSAAPIETALISLVAMPKALKAITATKFVSGIRKLTTNFKLVSLALSGNKTAADALSDQYPKLGNAVDVAKKALDNFRFGIDNGNFFTGLNSGIATVRNNLTGMQKGVIGAAAVFGEFVLVKDAFYDLASGSDNVVASLLKIIGGAGAASAALYVAFGPAGLVVAAITGVVAAFGGVKKAMDEMVDTDIGNDIKNALSNPGGTSMDDITKQFSDAMGAIGDSFSVISEKSQGLDTADANIRDTWMEIEKIETAMDAGVISVDEGTAELTRLFGELSTGASSKFDLLEDTLIAAFGENGVLSAVFKELGISTEGTTEKIIQLNDKVQQRIEELSQKLAGMDKNSPDYTATREELARLMGSTGDLDKAISDYKLHMDSLNIDYSRLVADDGTLDDEYLKKYLSSIATATEDADKKIEEAIAGVKVSLQEELQYAKEFEPWKEEEISAKIDALPDALTILQEDVHEKATALTDDLQNNLFNRMGNVIEENQKTWAGKKWPEKFGMAITGGPGTEDEFVKESIDRYTTSLNTVSDCVETEMGKFGATGAKTSEEATKQIVSALFDSKTVDAGVAGAIPKTIVKLRDNYKDIINGALDGAKTDVDGAVKEFGKDTVAGYNDSVEEHAETTEQSMIMWMLRAIAGIHDGPMRFGSPSKATYQFGVNTVKGYNNGVSVNINTTTSTMAQWMSRTRAAILNSAMRFSGISQTAYQFGLATVQGYNSGVSGNSYMTVNTIQDYMNAIENRFQGIVGIMNNLGVQAMLGFYNGIESMRGAIEQEAQSIADSVTRTIQSALDIHSPSRVMFDLGEYTMEGYQLGIESMYANLERSFNQYQANTVDMMLADCGIEPMTAVIERGSTVNNQYLADLDAKTDMSETNMLLREVLSAIQDGKEIVVDGRVLGKTLQRQNREHFNATGKGLLYI